MCKLKCVIVNYYVFVISAFDAKIRLELYQARQNRVFCRDVGQKDLTLQLR